MCKIRSADDCQRYDGEKKDHPFGTNSNVQWLHQVMAPTIQKTQHLGNIQGFFPPHTHIEMESGNHWRKSGLHHGGSEHIQITPHTRIES